MSEWTFGTGGSSSWGFSMEAGSDGPAGAVIEADLQAEPDVELEIG